MKKLVADGIADPKRICIVGGSYGGYMALAGASFSPDLYACAISYAGPSDLNRQLYRLTSFESKGISIWKRRIGADVDGSMLDRVSPANYAAQVKIPVLLLHSEKDTTVPIVQSEIEEKALKAAGKQVQFVALPGRRSLSRIRRYTDRASQEGGRIPRGPYRHAADSASH